MPLTEQEKLVEEQSKRMRAFEAFLDDKLAALRPEIKRGILGHTSVIAQGAYNLGRLTPRKDYAEARDG